MFPRALDEDLPCPSCTQFRDSLDGAAEHIAQRVNLAVVAKAPLPRILAHARERGWRRLRLLSSGANAYNRDYIGEATDGSQLPMLNVFRRDGEVIRHSWGSELLYAPCDPGQDLRHNDTIDAIMTSSNQRVRWPWVSAANGRGSNTTETEAILPSRTRYHSDVRAFGTGTVFRS
jgi:predicted dithiol-disulfide oxidoreductase (DUF899 family)